MSIHNGNNACSLTSLQHIKSFSFGLERNIETLKTTAMAQISTNSLPRRSHTRSASLENGTITSPLCRSPLLSLPLNNENGTTLTGTLKSRNEQKRLRQKYSSYSNLDEGHGTPSRSKFHNIRQMFEFHKPSQPSSTDTPEQQLQSLPTNLGLVPGGLAKPPRLHQKQLTGQLQTSRSGGQTAPPLQLLRKPSGNVTPAAITSAAYRLSMMDLRERDNQTLPTRASMEYSQSTSATTTTATTPRQTDNLKQEIAQQRSASDLARIVASEERIRDQTRSLFRPIAFKPIPFEPDYSIGQRCYDKIATSTNTTNTSATMAEHYGSTPSLAPMPVSTNLRFGSTTDLRFHGGVSEVGAFITNSAGKLLGHGHDHYTNRAIVGTNNNINNNNNNIHNSYNNNKNNNISKNVMSRRNDYLKSLKIHDSMESIRRTPAEMDTGSSSLSLSLMNNSLNTSINATNTTTNNNAVRTSTINANNNAVSVAINRHHNMERLQHRLTGAFNSSSCGLGTTNGGHNNVLGVVAEKYVPSEQCDMTPSPSDSGISDLEATPKDRDLELSFFHPTNDPNLKEKDSFWENEVKRIRQFYECQQKDLSVKIKKLEQMLTMQQFQYKQHKLKNSDLIHKLREQLVELRNECEILKTHNMSLKSSERNLKDRCAYNEEQLEESQNTIRDLRHRLEESEWRVCERNGELALLKTQLRDANNELTLKEHAIVHMKYENIGSRKDTSTAIVSTGKESQRTIEAEIEVKQLNKIVILKDQVILALTNELSKLRKELSDLVIFQEYGEEPSGKYIRLRQQLDNLSDICSRTRQQIPYNRLSNGSMVLDDCNLELIMNCLKIATPLQNESTNMSNNDNKDQITTIWEYSDATGNQRLLNQNNEINCDTSNIRNAILPLNESSSRVEEAALDNLIEETTNYAAEIAKLRRELDAVQINFEQEKRQWTAEKQKVLTYQKQLQMHYISMYQKLRNVNEKSTDV